MSDDDRETLPDGIMCCVQIRPKVNKSGEPQPAAEAWGIIDEDIFILIYSNSKAVWDECGYTGEPIVLAPSEMETVAHACGHEPEEVQVALAKFRLTGEVEPICSE